MTPTPSRRRSACCRPPDALDTDGLEIAAEDLETLLAVDTAGWKQAVPQIREHYAQFGSDLPASLTVALDTLDARLDVRPERPALTAHELSDRRRQRFAYHRRAGR